MTQNYGCNQQLADLLPNPAQTTVILLWGYLSKIPSKKNCCSRSSYFKDFLTRNVLGSQKKWYTKWDEFEFQRYRNQSEKSNRNFISSTVFWKLSGYQKSTNQEASYLQTGQSFPHLYHRNVHQFHNLSAHHIWGTRSAALEQQCNLSIPQTSF